MENLMNADVIKAAASSPLGTLSLMCLILGFLAMAFFKNAPVRAKILVFALLLIGVAGFGYSILNQKTADKVPEATRQYVIGRWQVEQKIAGMEGGTYIDYLDNGSFSGRQEAFIGGQGQRVPVSGTWDFEKLATDRFHLGLVFSNGVQWRGTFRILSKDQIHNIDENYDAVRVPR
ncbi:MAG: hypothetical protein GJV46_05510 [Geobacter sp.]|nr:hypothetical protein [Geobacter sp.]